ncbi:MULTISPECIES: helix-turn-helix transcriptional regulator [unclassified Mammaliicoccus]|uniref:helix-turn-helix domain-containing protein n=1 Tax=unclassified Mammaliicoccus TaxID=2803851 RepID=UPI001EFAEC61|nr:MULTISPECIES: helix-turn-helix transcriptional regulator [unclassified Mammaliicoccus]
MKNNLSLLMGKERCKISDIHRYTGVSRTTLQNLYYERTKNPDIQTVMKICKYFGITPNEFFGIKSKEM